MAIHKLLNPAPVGLDSLLAEDDVNDTPEIEIEIEDPEAIKISADGKTLLEIEKDEETDEEFGANLAEYVSDSILQTIALDLIEEFDEDIASRKDWIQTYVDGLELLGLKI